MKLKNMLVFSALALSAQGCFLLRPAVVSYPSPSSPAPAPPVATIPAPLPNKTAPPTTIPNPKPTQPKTATAQEIALILPLKLTETGSTAHTQRGIDSVLQFYQGFTMAMDSLTKLGLTANVNVIDNQNPGIDSLKNTNYDLIAQLQTDDAIKVFLQNGQRNKFNQYNVNPAMSEHVHAILSYVYSTFTNPKIVAIHRTQKFEVQVAESFLAQSKLLNNQSQPTEITNDKPKLADILPNLNKDQTNLIYLCSFDEPYVMNLMRELKTVAEPYRITIIGLPSWRNFKTIELDQFEKYHVIVSTANTNDYAEPAAAAYNFRKQYFVKYATEPKLQAYKGYDTGLYFGNMLLQKGNANRTEMLHNLFDFAQTDSGVFQNKGVNIMQYKNFRFEKLK